MFGFIVMLIVVVFVVLLLFSILKNLIKALLYALLIFGVLFGAMGIMVYSDISNFEKQAADSKNLFLLEDEGRILSALILSTATEDEAGLSVKVAEVPLLDEYDKLYQDGKLATIRGTEFYKIVVFNQKALSDYYAEEPLSIHNYTLDQKAVSRVLTSDEPYVTFKAEVTRANEVDPAYLAELEEFFTSNGEDFRGNDNNFRSAFFYAVVKDMLFDSKVSGTIYVVNQYKEGMVAIEPGSFLFSMVKWMPTTFFSATFEKMKAKAKETVKSAGDKALSAGSAAVSEKINEGMESS